METLLNILGETLEISLFVTVMMIAIEAVNSWTRGKLAGLLQGTKGNRQYFISSFLGAIPGCFGGFTNVSLYVHGLISLGALAGSMISVSGDEAFVMLALFPKEALILFAVLFVLGTIGGKVADMLIHKFKVASCGNCEEMAVHEHETEIKHFFTVHIWEHIIKRHVWRIFLWTFAALLVIEFGTQYLDLEKFAANYRYAFIVIAALLGIIPESGPHLIFATMFANGLVPFSVLLTSSMVQDGHGMLPLLSYSFKDSMKIKIYNFAFGLIVGSIAYLIGF